MSLYPQTVKLDLQNLLNFLLAYLLLLRENWRPSSMIFQTNLCNQLGVSWDLKIIFTTTIFLKPKNLSRTKMRSKKMLIQASRWFYAQHKLMCIEYAPSIMHIDSVRNRYWCARNPGWMRHQFVNCNVNIWIRKKHLLESGV